MKLKTDEHFVLTNSTNERRFTINASAQAFKILSSSLYSRKIEAIVRELSCNAYDSHVFANTPDKPFKVHMPNQWEPEFWIEDFGVGLNKEEVETIYTSYFTSTKNDSNDVIGGLGLGSKTPFSYTDSFNLLSRKDGKEYSYTAYINANGEPSVSLLSESDTTEPNGVRVSVPVSAKDFNEFELCAKRVYKYFRVLPEFNEASFAEKITQIDFEALDKYNYLRLSASQGKQNTIYALMGNVCYEVTNISSTFVQRLSQSAASYMPKIGLIIKFDIGELDVAASRETVSFDPETENKFIEKVESVCVTLINDLQMFIDTTARNPSHAINLTRESIGEWAEQVVSYKGIKISKLRHLYPSVFISECIENYYRPKHFPKPVTEYDYVAKKRHIFVDKSTGLPVLSTYTVCEHLLGSLFYFPPRNSVIKRERFQGGYTYKSAKDTAKLYVMECDPDTEGYEVTAKDYLRKLADNAGRYTSPTSVVSGMMITHIRLPDEVKKQLVDFLGDSIEFFDGNKAIADRKTRLRLEREANKEAKEKAAPGSTTKKPRIKKTDFRVQEIHSVSLSINPATTRYWLNYTNQENTVELNSSVIVPKYAVLVKKRGVLYTVNRTTPQITHRIIDLCHMMMISGIYTVYVIKEGDKRALDALMPNALDIKRVYEQKLNEFNVRCLGAPVADLPQIMLEHKASNEQMMFLAAACAKASTSCLTTRSSKLENFPLTNALLYTGAKKEIVYDEFFDSLNAIILRLKGMNGERDYSISGIGRLVSATEINKNNIDAIGDQAVVNYDDAILSFLYEETRYELMELFLDRAKKLN
jgi:hypothetical protein